MAQSVSCDPRAEVVAASRHRSGSVKLDNNVEAQPPLSPTPADHVTPAAPAHNAHHAATAAGSAQFINIRGKFEDTGGGGGPKSSSGPFGPNVSKMKERFQHGGRGTEDGHSSSSSASSSSSSHLQTSSSGRPLSGDSGERSPDSKRKKTVGAAPADSPGLAPALDPRRRSSSSATAADLAPPLARQPVVSPPMSPSHQSAGRSFSPGGGEAKRKKAPDSLKPLDVMVDAPVSPTEPALLEVTSHVQRFNYTRALFARMEEQTRREREKVGVSVPRRKVSPNRHTPTSSSPMLSPSAVSPVQETKKFPSAKDQQAAKRSSLSSDITASFSSGVAASMPSQPNDSLKRNRAQRAAAEEARRKSQSESGANSAVQQDSATDAVDSASYEQVLRPKRQQTKGTLGRDDSVGDRRGMYFSETVDSPRANGLDKSSDPVSATVMTGGDLNTPADEDVVDTSSSSSSLLSSSPPPFLPHCSRLEHSTRPSARLRGLRAGTAGTSASTTATVTAPSTSSTHSQQPRGGRDSDSASSTAGSGSGVTRRPRKTVPSDSGGATDAPALSAEEEAKKRLSREEIEAALERADTYLATLGSPDDTKGEKAAKERESRRSQSHAASAATRRRFLYGDEADPPSMSSSTSSLSSSSAGRAEAKQPEQQNQQHDVDSAKAAVSTHPEPASSTESKFIPEATAAAAVISSSSSSLASSPPTTSPPASPVKSSAYVQLRSQAPSTAPDLPPPSYHEATEPPPYHEATSSSSILFSQKMEKQQRQQQQQQGPSSSSSPFAKPVPIPRRAAPPPPLPEKPAKASTRVVETVPPPAPELGSAESELAHSVGSRRGVVVTRSNCVDDLIMPEEHMQRHDEDDDG
ncbi:platelet binding protein GspB [Aplysia californica]|uniref:Platelet binding protein GspB n=1 Tax=Aplysia californica TaxID=6500 RepID=A0ABM0K7C6_APLCA|nr:platelet binding protein GspB [Aplysia californica]